MKNHRRHKETTVTSLLRAKAERKLEAIVIWYDRVVKVLGLVSLVAMVAGVIYTLFHYYTSPGPALYSDGAAPAGEVPSSGGLSDSVSSGAKSVFDVAIIALIVFIVVAILLSLWKVMGSEHTYKFVGADKFYTPELWRNLPWSQRWRVVSKLISLRVSEFERKYTEQGPTYEKLEQRVLEKAGALAALGASHEDMFMSDDVNNLSRNPGMGLVNEFTETLSEMAHRLASPFISLFGGGASRARSDSARSTDSHVSL